MVADESLGLTFLDDSEANDAQVSYLKWFGGPPDGKEIDEEPLGATRADEEP